MHAHQAVPALPVDLGGDGAAPGSGKAAPGAGTWTTSSGEAPFRLSTMGILSRPIRQPQNAGIARLSAARGVEDCGVETDAIGHRARDHPRGA